MVSSVISDSNINNVLAVPMQDGPDTNFKDAFINFDDEFQSASAHPSDINGVDALKESFAELTKCANALDHSDPLYARYQTFMQQPLIQSLFNACSTLDPKTLSSNFLCQLTPFGTEQLNSALVRFACHL